MRMVMDLFERAVQLEKDAADFGFCWENTEQIMAQIQSECEEITAHWVEPNVIKEEMLQEEIGDLMHAVFSLCVFCKLSPKETLEKSLLKFERRLKAVKQLALNQGLSSLEGRPFDELMVFWDQAKQLVG